MSTKKSIFRFNSFSFNLIGLLNYWFECTWIWIMDNLSKLSDKELRAKVIRYRNNKNHTRIDMAKLNEEVSKRFNDTEDKAENKTWGHYYELIATVIIQ